MGVFMAGKEEQQEHVAAILKANHRQLMHYGSH
jgi:hypothetical protein